MTLTSRSPMWVVMVQHKTSDQYLTSSKVSTRSIHGFKRYRLLKTLSKNFNILSNAVADADANADADAVVTAIALPVLTYRRAKNEWASMETPFSHYKSMGNFCRPQGQLISQSVVWSVQNSNSSKILCMSSLPASIKRAVAGQRSSLECQ